MSKLNLLLLFFCASIVFGPIGSMLKLFHVSGFGTFMLMLSIAGSLTFIIMAIIEIFSSPRLTIHEKIMWAVCLFPLYLLTAILYLAIGRPRIVKEYKVLNL